LRRPTGIGQRRIAQPARSSKDRLHSLEITMYITRVLFALSCTFAVVTPALAQDYPVKPVRVLVPWPPGGANDIVARIVAQKLSENLGQQFIVDNRAGASGLIGAELVARGDADGYTLMVHSTTHVANPHMFKKVPYDTLRDFIGVTALGRQVGVLVLHPSMPTRTVKEFVALAKSRPGQIVYASSGSGSFVHLGMALIGSMTGTSMIHIPFKGGGPAATSLVSGETQAMVATIGSTLAHINANRVRAIGVTSEERVKQLPNVPTIAEGGVPGYEFTAWIGALVAARTPQPVVNRLNAELKRALESPDVARKLQDQTLDPMYMTTAQFDARIRADFDKYAKLIRLTGAKVD
jgi:tripartite-type tricarboxylate transporter receptor subunit TctC